MLLGGSKWRDDSKIVGVDHPRWVPDHKIVALDHPFHVLDGVEVVNFMVCGPHFVVWQYYFVV